MSINQEAYRESARGYVLSSIEVNRLSSYQVGSLVVT